MILENHYQDMQDIEFTIQEGKLCLEEANQAITEKGEGAA